jgi:voltage-gated potassium channel
MAIVDLLAILPFFLSGMSMDLRVLRGLRLMRLFRIAKLARYTRALHLLRRVLWSERESLVAAFSVVFLLVLLASSLMYFAERHAQPEAFSSIPAAMWWGVTTVTTVGYGDVYPITFFGRVLACAVAISGIGAFALPTAILGAAFLREWEQGKRPRTCQHCGKEIS